MAEYADREHYIPLHRHELVDLLGSERDVPRSDREKFRNFALILGSAIHFESHKHLEKLKMAYAPFDPDSQARTLHQADPEEREKKLTELFGEFEYLMNEANYRRLSREDLEAGLELETDLGIRVHVDFDQFERIGVWIRGATVERRTIRRWRNLWRLEDEFVPIYRRAVMILKLRPGKHTDPRVPTDKVFVQIFKNIPQRDLNMLLPGARVRFSNVDRGKIGFPLVTGLALAAWRIFTELADDLAKFLLFNHPAAVWAVATGTLGYSARSYYGYQQTKQRYSFNLTQVLYFQNLDTNGGVFFRVLDEAEEQEGREALLAYYFLWRHGGEQGWAAEALDDYIEIDLERRANLKIDFDVQKALQRLVERRVVQKVGDRYRAVPLDKALEMLDWTWDNYFKFNNPEIEAPPIA
jgi:hypothetical protein